MSMGINTRSKVATNQYGSVSGVGNKVKSIIRMRNLAKPDLVEAQPCSVADGCGMRA